MPLQRNRENLLGVNGWALHGRAWACRLVVSGRRGDINRYGALDNEDTPDPPDLTLPKKRATKWKFPESPMWST